MTNYLSIGLLTVGLAILILYPISGLVSMSFVGETGFTLEHYQRLISDRFAIIMVNTFTLGIAASLLATFWGTVFAWLCVSTDIPFRRALTVLLITPFGLATIAAALSWMFLLTPNTGLLNVFLMWLLRLDNPPFNIFTMPGMIWALSTHIYPWAFLFTSGAFSSMDRTLEDAARMAGASRLATFRKITLPLIFPSLSAAFILIFTLSIEQFSIGGTIGVLANIPILPVAIFRSVSTFPPEWSFATTLAVTLLSLTSVLIYAQHRMLGRRSFVTVTGREMVERTKLGKWRWPAFAISAAFVFVVVVLPYFGIIWVSVTPYIGSQLTLENLTLKHFVYALTESPMIVRAITNSFILASLVATMLALLGLSVALVMKRTQIPGRDLLGYLARLPIAFPGSVIAVGLLWVYIKPPLILFGTIWILLVAYATRYVPFAFSAAYAGLSQVDPVLEEASRIHGSSARKTFLRITVPLTLPSLAAGWIIVFINALRELPASLLLYTTGTETISVAVYNMFEEGAWRLPDAAALMLFISAVTLVPAVVVRLKVRGGGLG